MPFVNARLVKIQGWKFDNNEGSLYILGIKNIQALIIPSGIQIFETGPIHEASTFLSGFE